MQLSLFRRSRPWSRAQRPTCVQPAPTRVGSIVVDRPERGFLALVNLDGSRTLLAYDSAGECHAYLVEMGDAPWDR